MTDLLWFLVWDWIIPIYILSVFVAYCIWAAVLFSYIDDYRRDKSYRHSQEDVPKSAAKVVHQYRHWWYPFIWPRRLYLYVIRTILEAREDAKQ